MYDVLGSTIIINRLPKCTKSIFGEGVKITMSLHISTESHNHVVIYYTIMDFLASEHGVILTGFKNIDRSDSRGQYL